MGCTCGVETYERLDRNIEEKENILESNKNKNEEERVEQDQKTKALEEEIDQEIFNKEACIEILSSLPKREETNLQSLKDLIKSKTKKSSSKEKAYIIFLWICQNIDYDVESYFAGRTSDVKPDGTFKNGKTVCSGYSRLYRDISSYLLLEVECVSCYAKGFGYQPGQKMKKTEHEYNVIKLNNKWYPIDSTWGAGHIEKNNNYKRELNEFYFLTDPELLKYSHFPENPNWQLTKIKYTLEDFLKWPEIYSYFFKYGFKKFLPEEGEINLKNKNSKKFELFVENVKQKKLSCNIFLFEGNWLKQQLNTELVKCCKDKFEIDCLFNKKGKYKVEFYANDDKNEAFNHSIIYYIVNTDNDAKIELKFPRAYRGAEDIEIIEPIYDNLKSGSNVKFKIKSELEAISIIDSKLYDLKKNEEGFFEQTIEIQNKKGNYVEVGNKKEKGEYSILYRYCVV